MAEQVTLGTFNTLQNSSIISTLNSNNALIQNAFTDCVSLKGTAPNAMQSNLDMNSNQIINLPAPATANSPLRIGDINIPTSISSNLFPIITRLQALSFASLPITFITSGFNLAGDLGSGATYTSVGASSLGPMAFQNNGVWYQLVLNGPVNVGWFGVKCDGTDDTTAFQAALDALPANSTLYVTGQMTLAGGVQLSSKSNLTIDGMGTGGFKATGVSGINVATFGATVLSAIGCTNVIFRGLTINGNGFGNNLIGLYQCTECEISDTQTDSGGVQAALFSLGGSRNSIINNRVKNTIGVSGGIRAGNTNPTEYETNPIVCNNHIFNAAIDGINVVCYGGVIDGNTINTVGGSGIALAGASAGSIITRRTVVSNNTIKLAAFHGIQADAVGGQIGPGVIVTGNTVELSVGCGYYIVNAIDWTVTGNQSNDNGTGGSCTTGFVVQNAAHVVLTGNSAYNTTAGGSRTQQTGIQLTAQVGSNDVSDVTLSGNNVYNNSLYGIQVQNAAPGTMQNVSITGNNVIANGTYGIYAVEVSIGDIAGLLVAGNVMAANAIDDLYVSAQYATLGVNVYSTQVSFAALVAVTNNSATPLVTGRTSWLVSNSGVTTITDLTGSAIGKSVTLFFTTANTTVQNGTNIFLSGHANQTFTANSTLSLTKREDGKWYEIGRSLY